MEKYWRDTEIDKFVRLINSVSIFDINEEGLLDIIESLSRSLSEERGFFCNVLENILKYQIVTDAVLRTIKEKVPELDIMKFLQNNFRYGGNKDKILLRLEKKGLAYTVLDRLYTFESNSSFLPEVVPYDTPLYHSLEITSLPEIRKNISSFSGYDAVYCNYKVISIPLNDVVSVDIDSHSLTFVGSCNVMGSYYYNSEFKIWRKV